MSDKDLTNEQKLGIVAARIKGIKVEKFNAELNIIEQNALDTPEASIIASANKIIDNCDAQIVALEAQYNAISAG